MQTRKLGESAVPNAAACSIDRSLAISRTSYTAMSDGHVPDPVAFGGGRDPGKTTAL